MFSIIVAFTMKNLFDISEKINLELVRFIAYFNKDRLILR